MSAWLLALSILHPVIVHGPLVIDTSATLGESRGQVVTGHAWLPCDDDNGYWTLPDDVLVAAVCNL